MHFLTLLALPISLLAGVQATPVPQSEPKGCAPLKSSALELVAAIVQLQQVPNSTTAVNDLTDFEQAVETLLKEKCSVQFKRHVNCHC